MQMALVWAQRSYLTALTAASASRTAHAAKIKRNIAVILRLLNKAGVKRPLYFLQGE
jgi:hypothetical protein